MTSKHKSRTETKTETRTANQTRRAPESTTVSTIVSKIESEIDYKPETESQPAADSNGAPAAGAGEQPKSGADAKTADIVEPTAAADPPEGADAKPAAEADAKPADNAKHAADAKPGVGGKSAHGDENDLKSLSMPDLFAKLGSTKDGLTAVQAAKRLTQYGPNAIAEKTENPLLKFLTYFWGPIPWMIEAAVILSGIVRHWLDFGVILLLLCSNAGVGFWEEHQAGNAIAALRSRLAVKARVRRDGKWGEPNASDLVPGDVVRMRLGDIVPADVRLLAGADPIEVDQSALTGESLPATRKTGDAVFSGSIMRRGEASAVVYATGSHTYFGKTAQLVQEAQTVSHFQRAVLKIGDYLIVLATALVFLIVVVALFRHDPLLSTLEFALVLLVAAIPVAMPTVLSVTMAVGAKLLAKKQAIVTRLAAIEELAGVDVLCSDKTGTLTENKLTLGDPFCVHGITGDEVILDAALASRAEDKDPIDLAVLAGAKGAALNDYHVLHFQPFDPVHKRTVATVTGLDGKQFQVAKGAPQVILEMATDAAIVKPDVDKAVNGFAERGFRSLGVARADGDGTWKFVGVLPMSDPPRPQAKATIANARQMGVHIKMVTGDAIAIAREMSRVLGLGTNILDASGLHGTKPSDVARADASIEQADGFAQVFPADKFHIIDVLQKSGHIVGMTGDGVNDAPALKKADCGVAVSGATDAARAAASIVLLAPGLSVIIDAIKESRRIFKRMNSYAMYRIAETLRVLLFMVFAILVFNFYPVTAVMIVMLALLNDGAILSIAYDEVRYRNMPEAWDMRQVLGVSTVLGVVGVVTAFGLFYLGERVFHLDRSHVQTLMYLKLSVAGHLTIFLTRTRGPWWSTRPANILLFAVLGTQMLATLMAVYGLHIMTPIGWQLAAFVWGYAIVCALLTDPVKLLAYRILDPSRARTSSRAAKPVDRQPHVAGAT
jgi:H+-transporting ATPase